MDNYYHIWHIRFTILLFVIDSMLKWKGLTYCIEELGAKLVHSTLHFHSSRDGSSNSDQPYYNHHVALSWIFTNAYSREGNLTPLFVKFVGGVARYIHCNRCISKFLMLYSNHKNDSMCVWKFVSTFQALRKNVIFLSQFYFEVEQVNN